MTKIEVYRQSHLMWLKPSSAVMADTSSPLPYIVVRSIGRSALLVDLEDMGTARDSASALLLCT